MLQIALAGGSLAALDCLLLPGSSDTNYCRAYEAAPARTDYGDKMNQVGFCIVAVFLLPHAERARELQTTAGLWCHMGEETLCYPLPVLQKKVEQLLVTRGEYARPHFR